MSEILTTTPPSGNIHKALVKIMRKIGHVSKKQRAKHGDQFYYRGIDDLYNALHPIMAHYGVYIRTVVRKREVTERQSKAGNAMQIVALLVDHIFTQEDGSNVTVTTVGEAMDTSDKASNKAMSGAMKYALIQTFAIPTAGATDSERDNFEPEAMAHKQQPEPQAQPRSQPQTQTTQAEPTQPAPAATTQSQQSPEGTDTCYIESTQVKREGTQEDGKTWTLWTATNDKGKQYDTFSDSFISIASDCCNAKCKAQIKWKRGKYGYEITDIVPIQPDGAAAAGPIENKITCDITNVTHRNEEDKDGTQIDVWAVDTDKGRFGCVDPDVAVYLRDFVKGTTPAILTYVDVSRGKKIIDIKADVPF